MLYHLFDYLERTYESIGAGLFQYITFRTGLAIIISLFISLIMGGRIIRIIKRFQILEKQRALGLPGEALKAKTPTMGGIMIILAIVIPTLLMADLTNVYIQLLLLCTVWMGAIGFTDDYLKLTKGKAGLAGRYKILGQVGLGLVVGAVMLWHSDIKVRVSQDEVVQYNYEVVDTITERNERYPMIVDTFYNVKSTLTNVPFVKGNQFEYAAITAFFGDNGKTFVWIVFIPFIIIVVTAVSNAANLTDGLDGLATGISAIIGATLGILAYLTGNTVFSDYLNILYIPDSGELVVFVGAFLGACLGYLWYNAYPAKVFMGDTGSLTLGGLIATLAIVIRKELLIPILCGIFVVENLSVMIQVGWFKYTKRKYGKGRRVFLMSPLHHHFQKKGWHEATIVTRFWIIGILLAVLTLITLKVR